jgi:hypothetical protein
MKKVIYLHGLETPQGGKKIDYLTQHSIVYAPKVDYKNPNEFQRILNECKTFKPDLIIGSSIGGYMAHILGSYFDAKVMLFNPALHSRTFEIENFEYGYLSIRGDVILGEDDDIINPLKTIEFLKNSKLKIKTISGMGHRTPSKIFYQEVSGKL